MRNLARTLSVLVLFAAIKIAYKNCISAIRVSLVPSRFNSLSHVKMPRIPSSAFSVYTHTPGDVHSWARRSPLTREFKLKPLKTNENGKGSRRTQFYEQKRDHARPSCVGKRDTRRRHAHISTTFYAFPHACISRGHVSTNIPHKPGGMKSFAPFWPSRRRRRRHCDERFVELTRKIFPS